MREGEEGREGEEKDKRGEKERSNGEKVVEERMKEEKKGGGAKRDELGEVGKEKKINTMDSLPYL